MTVSLSLRRTHCAPAKARIRSVMTVERKTRTNHLRYLPNPERVLKLNHHSTGSSPSSTRNQGRSKLRELESMRKCLKLYPYANLQIACFYCDGLSNYMLTCCTR